MTVGVPMTRGVGAKARPLIVSFLTIAIGCAGCASVEVKAPPPAPKHKGTFHKGKPIIEVGPCCRAIDAAKPLKRLYKASAGKPDEWQPVCDVKGVAFPAGHKHDVYYTGNAARPTGAKRPAGYRFRPSVAAAINRRIAGIRVELAAKDVRIPAWPSKPDGNFTAEGAAKAVDWLKKHLGNDAQIKQLGEGGFAVAYRVCREKRPCVVVKLRKTPPTKDVAKRIKQSETIVSDLKRDIAVGQLAAHVVSWATFKSKGGKSEQIARVAVLKKTPLMQFGVVQQELIAYKPQPASAELLAAARKENSKLREDAMAEAAFAGVSPGDTWDFFDTYHDVRSVGPEVHKALAFFRACRRLGAVAPIKRFCAALKRDFAIPADFDERVRALEWMYRDTAATAIRFARANFPGAVGNAAADGVVREIGLDYNHGRNAGWDPRTKRFVLFDW